MDKLVYLFKHYLLNDAIRSIVLKGGMIWE